jgi:hypothetical protein
MREVARHVPDTLIVALVAIRSEPASSAGYRFFLVLLPLFGCVAGFYVGSAAVTAIFGNGFLSEITGWVVGFVGGIAFGLLSYFFFIVGVIILAASLGASIGAALASALGLGNVLEFLLAAIGAIALAGAAVVLAVPKYLVVAVTAIIGAATVVAGILLLFGTIKLPALQKGPIDAIVDQGGVWLVVFVVLAVVGIAAQLRSFPTYVLDPEGPRLG